jgi:lysine-specific demethylase/histidyl-hydroxylase NO66
VDRLVSSSFARLPAFRLVRNGTPVPQGNYTRSARLGGKPVSGVGDPGKVWEEFRTGATIVLQGLQRYWPPLTRFCRRLELELTHPVQCNAYITPAGSQGLAVHYDTHDVFVLQVAGSKEWTIHPPVLENPLPSQPWTRHKADPPPPCLSVDLQAGETLYVPRGFLHSARAQKDLSAHLTVGVLCQTWHDVMREVVAGSSGDVTFRRALPAGYADDEETFAKDVDATVGQLRQWLDTVDAQAVASTVVRRFWSSRSALLDGHLRQLLHLDDLTDGSTVRRREGAICHLWTEGDQLVVLLGDRRLRMPAALEPALRRIAGGQRFSVNGLADLLDEPSRMVLVRRLIREGLLELLE